MNHHNFPCSLRRTSWASVFCAVLCCAFSAFAAEPATPAPAPDSAAPGQLSPYPLNAFAALGSQVVQSNHLAELGWSEPQIAAFVDGIRAAFQHKSYPFDESAKQMSEEMARRIQQLAAQPAATVQPLRYDDQFRAIRKRLGLQVADNGLGYRIDVGRGGQRPRPSDTVVFSCLATKIDGVTKLPQLTVEHVTARMEELFPGFRQGFQMMTTDSRAILVLPPALSFGSDWPPDIEPGMPIVFQVTLHQIIPANTP